MHSKLSKVAMHSDRAELNEHLRLAVEAGVLVVSRMFTLLGFLFGLWLDTRATPATLQAIPTGQSEKPMSVEEAAEFYDIPKNTIYELIKRREIPFIKIGKSLRIPHIPTIEPINSNENSTPTRRRNVLP